jgi:hypothetical protein
MIIAYLLMFLALLLITVVLQHKSIIRSDMLELKYLSERDSLAIEVDNLRRATTIQNAIIEDQKLRIKEYESLFKDEGKDI